MKLSVDGGPECVRYAPSNTSPLSIASHPKSLYSCEVCCVVMDTAESLDVHNMHFHPDNHRNDWAPTNPSNGSVDPNAKPIGSPTDLKNNNLVSHDQQQHIPRNTSPLNNTVSAAADSSDNQQQNSPQSTNASDQGHQVTQPRATHTFAPYENSPYANNGQQQQLPPMHPNATLADMQSQYPYLHTYDHQFYHAHGLEFPPPTTPFPQHPSLLHQPLQPSSQHEYKSVPSPRFHPYMNHQNGHQITPSASHSPRVVSSSASPSHNNAMMNQQLPPPGQPTPSPSPKQCDKCSYVCETNIQLNEHYMAVHSANAVENRSGSTDENDMPNFQYTNQYNTAVKDEPTGDILDLDSHKMVYPPIDGSHPQHGPLPSMQTIQPVQRAMHWSAEHHAFITPSELIKTQNANSAYTPIKSEYTTPNKSDFSPGKQSDYGIGSATHISHMHHDSTKSFGSDVSVGNHMATSPSEFPSTTTPQENNGPFRSTFEATSSLPNSTPVVKAGSWKSNEARRPKTYNCTACNKWFTSSGHLKRHYNTTLHKNAVKSSGQPDPATLPISVHHHPTRDQNKIGHQRGSPAQPAAAAPPEPTTSPDYASQYTPPLGFPQAQQGYQQFESTSLQTSNHPNGQAGPSDPTSQPRDLLICTTNTGIQQQQTILQQQANDQLQQQHSMEMVVLQQGPDQQHQQMIIMEDQQLQQLDHLRLDHQHHHQHQDIFMPQILSITSSNNTNSHNTILSHSNISNTISNLHLHQLHHLPSNTTSLEQDQYQLTTTLNPMESTRHINLITSPSTTITTTNHLYPVPSDLAIIPLQSEHHTPTYHTIIGNQQLQQHTTTVDENGHHITQLSSATDPNMYQTYQPMLDNDNDQENMDPTIYTIVPPNMINMYSRPESDMLAYNESSGLSPCSSDVAEPFQIVNRMKRANTPDAGFPITPSPSPPHNGINYGAGSSTTPDHQKQQQQQQHPHPQQQQQQIQKQGYEVSSYGNTTIHKENNQTPSAKDNTTNSKRAAVKRRSAKARKSRKDEEGPLRCDICDKVFNKTCYLTQHNLSSHSGDRPFKCTVCGKRFTTQKSQQEHSQKHTGAKPYKCEECAKSFNHKTDLRRHMCKHTGFKPHHCPECEKGFIRKDHMVKHIDTHTRKTAKMQNITSVCANSTVPPPPTKKSSDVAKLSEALAPMAERREVLAPLPVQAELMVTE